MIARAPVLAATLLLVTLLAGAAAGQELVWRATGVDGSRGIGRRTAAIGDINQDGYEDLVTIVDGHCGVGFGYSGYLWLLSGRDGVLLREVPALNAASKFDLPVAAGDMNGDGIPDYAVMHHKALGPGSYADHVEVRSGVDDTVLWFVSTPGHRLLSDLDTDGDGAADIVVGQFGVGGFGQVRVYAHGGQLRYQLNGNQLGVLGLGFSLSKLADIDGDGCDDFVMGAGEATLRGAAVIVSGATGQYLRICYGELPNDGLNYIVSEAGDLDGDGYTDFVVGNGRPFGSPRGVVRAFSSRTGLPLHQWVGYGQDYSKGMASRGVDLDGDGLGDVVIGSPWEPVSTQQEGVVYAYSGRDGSLLHRFESGLVGGQPFSRIGWWVTTLRPPPGEHIGLVIVPDAEALPNSGVPCTHFRGAISAYRAIPRTSRVLGPACAGHLAVAPDIGMQSLGPAGVRVHLSGAPDQVLSMLVVGLSTTQFLGVPLPVAIDPLGFPGCWLRTSAELGVLAVTSGGPNGGYAHVDLPLPVPVSGMGSWDVSCQWVVLGDAATFPGGWTQAMAWRR